MVEQNSLPSWEEDHHRFKSGLTSWVYRGVERLTPLATFCPFPLMAFPNVRHGVSGNATC